MPLLGWEMKGLIKAMLSFPNSLCSLEGPRTSLSLDYEFILLPLHSMGMLYTQYWLCSGGSQFSCHSAGESPSFISSRSCCQPFWSGGARRQSAQWMRLYLLPCLSRKGQGCSRLLSIFQTVFLFGMGTGATLSLSYELIHLPLCSMRTLHTPYCLCFGGNQLCPSNRLQQYWAIQFQELLPALLVRCG